MVVVKGWGGGGAKCCGGTRGGGSRLELAAGADELGVAEVVERVVEQVRVVAHLRGGRGRERGREGESR